MTKTDDGPFNLPESRASVMSRLAWLDNCARRLCELDKAMTLKDAYVTATELAHHQQPRIYREMHPVAAAECFLTDCIPGMTDMQEKFALWRKA